ncbi:MAG: 16S rRNA (cytosine(1402)-N(4))-methyltransferase, partial [Thermoguttaceae bacterium]|nr:16S rRNA (cytosine(1402)-N(4))-methyltransferase [Thermoguttaceae bacterium]
MTEVKSSIHVSVMPDEVLKYINPQPGQVVVDGTLGGAGHAKMIASRLAPGGCL